MKKNISACLITIGIIMIGVFFAVMIVENTKELNNRYSNNNINNYVSKDYFDSFSYSKTINNKNMLLTIKYYKDDFKFEESCFKVYFDVFVNDKLVKSYREGSPYEVKVHSLIYTSNFCRYDNSDVDDISLVTSKVNEYIKNNTYVIKGDKEYLGLVLPSLYVSSYNEAKLLILNDEGNNIYTSYIQKQKEDIVSIDNCSIKYNKSLYGQDVNVIKADDKSFYYLIVDAHLVGEVNTFTENKININNNEVDIEIVNKCSGK